MPTTRLAVSWRVALVATAALGALSTGCGERSATGPIIAQSSLEPLLTEAHRALEAAREARRSLPEEPEAAQRALDRAVLALDHLNGFYLPVLEARDRALNALRYLESDQPQRALKELAEIETALDSSNDEARASFARELDYPLKLLVDARRQIESRSAGAGAALEELVRRLNLLEIKGELALHAEGEGSS